MEIIIVQNSEAAAKLAADLVARVLKRKPNAVFGFATGSTPLPLYRELVRMHREEGLDFSRASTFNLDEYVGLSPDHPASYHFFMRKHLFQHVNVSPERIHLPDGTAKDVSECCRRYEDEIARAGGIDLQILGIGRNGHIGFNEPSSSLSSRTRIKTLTPQTIKDNAASFGSPAQVPRHVVTMGVGTILDSRRCLLMAFGESKASAVSQMAEGPITAMVPASALQLHRRAHILLDEAAASRLSRREYYEWVWANKPPQEAV